GLTATFDPILTILGGTVGGYITFAGAHRLIDAGVTGEENKGEIQKSSVTGIIVAAVVRVLLFLAILGVIAKNAGVTLDASNPVADAFLLGAGQIGYRFAGLVLSCAAVTSIIGAAYTSVSFLKTFNKNIDAHENQWVIGFIVVSTIIMLLVGTTPAVLLVFAGAFNGLILPITLLICLIAAKNKKIVGDSFSYSNVLWVLGLIVVVISGYLGITTFISKIAGLF
ncbi:MAG: hypothetical protein LIO86_08085, partial [Lachnospiraceae bacterium]|nr:hypothetical protein [Lachnospiraceae bacterium]